MGHISSPRPDLSASDRKILSELALTSIEHGLKGDGLLKIDEHRYSPGLRAVAAAFVTLKRNGQLRGCIGSIVACQPLVLEVVDKAYGAAFGDPRFLPLSAQELKGLDIHISVLTPLEEISFSSEQDLLEKVRPGQDGLVLEDGGHKGTFLPAMWEQLPERRDFVNHLKLKAGLPVRHWSKKVRVWRFSAESIPAEPAAG
jgi:uncharacterized protein